MNLKYCYVPVVFLTLLTAVAARADEVQLAYDGKTLNADRVIADEARASDEIMLISSKGTMVRTRVDEVSVQGRNTQGVRLIRLKEGEKLVGLERVDEPAEEFVEELNSEQSENDENNAD